VSPAISRSSAPQRRKDQRAPEILAAARPLFEQHGVEATSVAAIARQAGVSEATVFKYFDTKQDLVERVVLDWIEPAVERLEADVRGMTGTRARLEHIAFMHLADMALSPQLHTIVYRDLRWHNYEGSPLRKMVQRWTRVGVWVIEQGIAEGELRADLNVIAVRDIFYGGLEQTGWRTALSGRRLDVGAEAKAIINVLLAGIVATAPVETAASSRQIEQALAALGRIEAVLRQS
jgi:AcrR family transcriptional regulator